MKCLKCGVENNPTNLTCAGCGELFEHGRGSDRTMALQPVDVEEDAGQFETTAFEEPSLIVTKGPYVGQRFELVKSEITLGRDPGNDIFLDDVTVSRKHARIVIAESGLTIEDVGSLNGTYLNNERVDSRTLCQGDELQIGKYKLLFVPAKR